MFHGFSESTLLWYLLTTQSNYCGGRDMSKYELPWGEGSDIQPLRSISLGPVVRIKLFGDISNSLHRICIDNDLWSPRPLINQNCLLGLFSIISSLLRAGSSISAYLAYSGIPVGLVHPVGEGKKLQSEKGEELYFLTRPGPSPQRA